jgi:hypothetical protein
MKKILLTLTFIILMFSNHLFACDCDSKGSFFEVSKNSDFIALVKINKYLSFEYIYEEKTPMSMEVEIIQIFKGNETRKSIIVWGDNGILCRPYLSFFKIGEYYVIAFDKGLDGTKGHVHKSEKNNDYAISNCGTYWLNVNFKSKIANGYVSKTQRKIKLKKIKESLN